MGKNHASQYANFGSLHALHTLQAKHIRFDKSECVFKLIFYPCIQTIVELFKFFYPKYGSYIGGFTFN